MKRPILYSAICLLLITSMSAQAYIAQIIQICKHAIQGRANVLSVAKKIAGATIENDEIQMSPRNGKSQPSQPQTEMDSSSFQTNTKHMSEQLRALNGILIMGHKLLLEIDVEPIMFFKSTQSNAKTFQTENTPHNYNISNIWLNQLSEIWEKIHTLCTEGLICEQLITNDELEVKKQDIISSISPILEEIDQQRKSNTGSSKKRDGSQVSLKKASENLRKSFTDFSTSIKPNEKSSQREGTPKPQLESSSVPSSPRSAPPLNVESLREHKKEQMPPEVPLREDVSLRVSGIQSMNERTLDRTTRQRVQSAKSGRPLPVVPPRSDLDDDLS